MALPFSIFLDPSNSLSLMISDQLGVGAYASADSIVRRLSGSYSLPSDFRTSAKNRSRVPFRCCLGISSSLWGSSRHLLHASKRFTHVFVDIVVFLFNILEFLQISRSSRFENGAGLLPVLRFVLNECSRIEECYH